MVTAQRASQLGSARVRNSAPRRHHVFQSSFEARGSDATHGSPLAIFRGIAAGFALLVVTGGAIGAVAHLAQLINTSWRVLLMA